jgi:zinc protease
VKRESFLAHIACVALVLGALGCTHALPPAADAVHVSLPSEHYRLPNGLEVVLHRDPAFDAAVVDVRYHVGSKDDPEGESGFAHLHEHLTFRTSAKGGSETLTSMLEAHDFLAWNAFTTSDETEYFELVPRTQLPAALFLEAMRMSRTLEGVREDAFAREREVVKNEYRQNYETRPYGFVETVARAALFPAGHPYHRPVIGDLHDLDRTTLEDARRFAQRFYTPRNATLVVAGNIDIEETRALVARHFGGLDPGLEPPPARSFAFPALSVDRIVHVEADVERPRLLLAWPLPPRYAKSSYEAQLVAAEVGAVVKADLEHLREMAHAVDSNVRWGRLGSVFSLGVELRAGKQPEDALAAIEVLVPFVTSPIVERAADIVVPRVEWWLKASVSEIASLPARAKRLQDFTEFFGRPDAADDDLARYRAARRPGTKAAGAAYLNSHKIAVMVRPVAGAPRAGRVVKAELAP